MKKWLLILIAAVAFACGDGTRDENDRNDDGTGTTSSGGIESTTDDDDNDAEDMRMNGVEQDTSRQLSADTTGTTSSEGYREDDSRRGTHMRADSTRHDQDRKTRRSDEHYK